MRSRETDDPRDVKDGSSETATGGSASTQAVDADGSRWRTRRTTAAAIRLVAFVLPFAASFTVARILAVLLPAPRGAAGTAGWQLELADNLSTGPRLERARMLAGALGEHGVEDLKRLLRDESQGFLLICRHPDPSLPEQARIETVASVIMDLAHATMHVAPDIPSQTEYQPVPVQREAEVVT